MATNPTSLFGLLAGGQSRMVEDAQIREQPRAAMAAAGPIAAASLRAGANPVATARGISQAQADLQARMAQHNQAARAQAQENDFAGASGLFFDGIDMVTGIGAGAMGGPGAAAAARAPTGLARQLAAPTTSPAPTAPTAPSAAPLAANPQSPVLAVPPNPYGDAPAPAVAVEDQAAGLSPFEPTPIAPDALDVDVPAQPSRPRARRAAAARPARAIDAAVAPATDMDQLHAEGLVAADPFGPDSVQVHPPAPHAGPITDGRFPEPTLAGPDPRAAAARASYNAGDIQVDNTGRMRAVDRIMADRRAAAAAEPVDTSPGRFPEPTLAGSAPAPEPVRTRPVGNTGLVEPVPQRALDAEAAARARYNARSAELDTEAAGNMARFVAGEMSDPERGLLNFNTRSDVRRLAQPRPARPAPRPAAPPEPEPSIGERIYREGARQLDNLFSALPGVFGS